MAYDFTPNPDASIQTQYVGNERQPVVVIDDFFKNPQSLVAFAAEATRFGPAPTHYPGLQAPIPREYMMSLFKATMNIFRDTFGLDVTSRVHVDSFFGIVTTPSEQLNVGQRLPHIDTPNPLQVAALHYLCDPSFGGTAFYRHRATGYESCDEKQYLQVCEMLAEDEKQNGPLPPQYVTGSSRIYEQTASIDAKFNRLLIYRSRVFHSGTINPAARLSADPRTGRLTANCFISFERGIARPA